MRGMVARAPVIRVPPLPIIANIVKALDTVGVVVEVALVLGILAIGTILGRVGVASARTPGRFVIGTIPGMILVVATVAAGATALVLTLRPTTTPAPALLTAILAAARLRQL